MQPDTHSVIPARRGPLKAIDRRFARHYLEMVVVMFLGMAVLGLPAGWALEAAGLSWSDLHSDAPAAALLLMAFTMTAPMVWWMHRMGHGARANVEMAMSMIVPTLGVIGLLAAGMVADLGALVAIQHVAMLAGMLAVMLARAEEYSGHHRAAHLRVQADASSRS